jgi:3-isopropylmalate/(R)-2-methylmalate dehydratase small subunit
MADAKDKENPELEIDLPSQEIRRPNGSVIKFEIDPFRKKCLLEGLDDIGITMEKSEEIQSFESKMSSERPWL